MSVNKKAIIDAVYQGSGQLATNPMPPTQWSYNKNIKDAPYDVAKAKQLLAKAGYPNGFEMTLWAMPVQRPYNPNAKLMAEMLSPTGPRSASRPKSSATNGANTSSAARTASMTCC